MTEPDLASRLAAVGEAWDRACLSRSEQRADGTSKLVPAASQSAPGTDITVRKEALLVEYAASIGIPTVDVARRIADARREGMSWAQAIALVGAGS